MGQVGSNNVCTCIQNLITNLLGWRQAYGPLILCFKKKFMASPLPAHKFWSIMLYSFNI